MKMKALDLFCCCGGAAKGLNEAGFDVTGVDITDGHDYPFTFIQEDVFNLDPDFIQKFDLIWASPPCQFYIPTNKRHSGKHSDLLPATRELLKKSGKPYIIENVPGAPIRKDVRLCGEMFGLRIVRHRYFEIEGFTVLQPVHEKHKLSVMDGTAVACYSGGINPGFWGDKEKQKAFRKKRKASYYAQVAGHGGDSYSFKIQDWKDAMGVYHINKRNHLTQAVPPAYSHYISQFFSPD